MRTLALLDAARCFGELARLASTLGGNWLASRMVITKYIHISNARSLWRWFRSSSVRARTAHRSRRGRVARGFVTL